MRSSALPTRVLAAFLVGASLGGCRGAATRPPYSIGAAPAPDLLLAAASPALDGIRVSAAKIRLGRGIAGNLMMIAQRPDRFSGQIQISGKELVSLAFHEEGYALRYVAGEGLPAGFYSGPPSECAIAELLGVPMAPRELIALILGGAPLLPGKAEVIDQGWDRREGHEILRLRSGELEEELRFAWLGDRWWPVGASLYRRRGAELLWIWTVLHEDPRAVDGATLPSKTVITRPDGRRKQKVTITYKAQEPNPAVLAAADDSGGDDTGWEDDGGWEGEGEGNGDGGWESGGEGGEGAAAGAGGAGEGATPASEPAPKPASKPASKPAKPTKPAIPSLFTLTGDGLPDRGNLCRYHRHS